MLSLGKITPKMGGHYYAQEDYYSKENGPATPEFVGKGCDLLGIKPDFNPVTFQKLLEGKSPANEKLRLIKVKQFKEKGRESFLNISTNFLNKVQKRGIDFDREALENALSEVLEYSNIEIKYKENKDKILKAIDEHHISGTLNPTAKKKLLKNLMIEVCEHGALNGRPITTLPENYVAFEHPIYGKMAHKLIDRHFYLSGQKGRELDNYNLHFNVFKKYYPELEQIGDYKTSIASRKKLDDLMSKAPVIGLWNDDNIFKLTTSYPPEIDREFHSFVEKGAEDLKKKGHFDLDSMGFLFEEAEKRFKNKAIITKDKLSFESFCEQYSLNKNEITQEINSKKSIDLKSHLNSFQAELLSKSLDSKIKNKKLIETFVESISQNSDRAGIDLTFSAPKSVSLATLVGGDKRLLEAHKNAVKYVLSYVETNYIGARVGSKDQRVFEKTGNMIGATFHHGSSREHDPQLHTHCTIMNTTLDSKGKWKAIHNDGIYKNSVLLGTLYQKALADQVMDMGYKIAPAKNGTFELVGYTDKQLQAFSKGSKKIQQVLKKELMNNSAKSKREAVLIERKKKEIIEPQALKKKWVQEAADLKLAHPQTNEKTIRKEMNWKFATSHLSEKDSIWSQEKLLLETLKSNIDRGNLATILKNYENKSEVEIVTKNGQRVGYTNNQIIEIETKILNSLREGRAKYDAIAPDYDFKEINEKRGLTKGQSEAFKLAMTNKDFLSAWVGVAGSGKSYVLEDVKNVAKSHGYEVVGLGQDAKTVKELSKSVENSLTVDKFLLKKRKIGPKKNLWIVDEASKLSSKKLLQLIKKAQNDNARILLTGDTRQTGAIEAGAPFQLVLNNKIAKAELPEHRRQKNEDLKKIVNMASSKETVEKSVRALEGSTFQLKTKKARLNKIAKIYKETSKEKRKGTLIITDNNQDRRELTSILRRELKKEGALGQDSFQMPILRAKNITRAQKVLFWTYEKGDIIVPFKDIEGTNLKKNIQYSVQKINKKTGKIMLKGEHSSIEVFPSKLKECPFYREDFLDITSGDKLSWTKNDRGRINKEESVIEKIQHNKVYFKNDHRPIKLSERQYLDHGLVQSTYSSQGQTSDSILYLAESNISRETWYVAISRAKHKATIVTDNREKLANRVLKSNKKLNALDFDLQKKNKQELER